MSYGTSLGITLPTVGVTVGPTWATNLNTALSSIIAVLETKVTPAGMDINADLSYRSAGTSYRAKDVKAVSLTNQDSTLAAGTYPTTLFTSDSDGELYFNDNAGRQVQVTSNGSVNVSTSGGITGSGYGTASVEVNWDSGSSTYRMRDGAAADDFAHVEVDDVKLNDGSAHTLTVAAPAMAADYTFTLPAAVPAASNTILQMATSGAVTASNTVGSITTNSGGVTVASGQHVTVAGTGRFKHGTLSKTYPGNSFTPTAWTNVVAFNDGSLVCSGTDGHNFYKAADLPVGARVIAVSFYAQHGASGSTRTARLVRIDLATLARTVLADETDTTSGDTTVTVNLPAGELPETIEAGYSYFLEYDTVAIANEGINGAQIDYDWP